MSSFLRLLGAALLVLPLVGCGPPQPGFKNTDVTGADCCKDFRLTDHNGKVRTLADFRGKAVVMFFGYTQCPDVCPTTMLEMKAVLQQLGADAQRVQVLFVTVDPERDTPAVMKDYLSSFDPHLRGATGDPKAIDAVVKAYRVYAKKVPTDNGDYSMDHTALVYLMDKQGRFVAPFKLNRKPEDAAADLRKYM